MRVYLIDGTNSQDIWTEGIFSSRGKATLYLQQALGAHIFAGDLWHVDVGEFDRNEYTITEHEVDVGAHDPR